MKPAPLLLCLVLLFLAPNVLSQTARIVTIDGSSRALALDSATMVGEPFQPTSTQFMVFVRNLPSGNVRAEAMDFWGRVSTLTVTHVCPLEGAPDLTEVVLNLDAGSQDVGDMLLQLSVNGLLTNSVRVGIGHIGGGPPEGLNLEFPEPSASPTPVPSPSPSPEHPCEVQVVYDGNSLTAGTYLENPATEGYPAQSDKLLKQSPTHFCSKVNGVAGITTPMMTLNGPILIDPLFDASIPDVLMFWEIGNDIDIDNADGPTAVARALEYIQARRARGYRVIVGTVPPRANWATAPLRKAAQEYANDYLRQHWQEFADGLADFDDPRFSGNPSELFIDGVHFTKAGYSIIADIASKAILQDAARPR
jgi:lysophospholipase L1-like esterase